MRPSTVHSLQGYFAPVAGREDGDWTVPILVVTCKHIDAVGSLRPGLPSLAWVPGGFAGEKGVRVTVVAISSLAGSGGALIAPEVARRLSLPFVDRAIPMQTARRLAMDETAVLEQEEHPEHGLARFVHLLAPASGIYTAPLPEMEESDVTARLRQYRAEEERVIREHADNGAVILGRGSGVVLADHPRALRVSLVGPVEDRIKQLAELSGISIEHARQQQHEADHLRRAFIRRLLHADPFDPKYYQLIIDSTKLPFSACVKIIVEAVHGLEEHWKLDD